MFIILLKFSLALFFTIAYRFDYLENFLFLLYFYFFKLLNLICFYFYYIFSNITITIFFFFFIFIIYAFTKKNIKLILYFLNQIFFLTILYLIFLDFDERSVFVIIFILFYLYLFYFILVVFWIYLIEYFFFIEYFKNEQIFNFRNPLLFLFIYFFCNFYSLFIVLTI